MVKNKLDGKLLYSTCSYLAFKINKRYYHNIHYVWCTDTFYNEKQPGTSSPHSLCRRYLEAIKTQDGHDSVIIDNIKGIKHGAEIKRLHGIITLDEEKEICSLADTADWDRFYPILYLIHRPSVKNRLLDPPEDQKANKDSVEYIISDLQRHEFEIISYKHVLDLLYRDDV